MGIDWIVFSYVCSWCDFTNRCVIAKEMDILYHTLLAFATFFVCNKI